MITMRFKSGSPESFGCMRQTLRNSMDFYAYERPDGKILYFPKDELAIMYRTTVRDGNTGEYSRLASIYGNSK